MLNEYLYRVNFQQLDLFFYVAEARSFTKAATRFQMTQSAVSKSMAKMERDLFSEAGVAEIHYNCLTFFVGQRGK